MEMVKYHSFLQRWRYRERGREMEGEEGQKLKLSVRDQSVPDQR
jgi:hypothetical protein